MKGTVSDLCGRGLRTLSNVNIPPVSVLLIRNNELRSFAGLKFFDMEVIDAENNRFDEMDANILHFQSLVELKLGNNSISKILPMASVPNLKVLDLSGNRISVIENLEGLESIEDLNISRNRIHSVFLKSPIPSLKILNLGQNVLDRINFGSVFPNLISLNIDNCFLSSLNGIDSFKSLKNLSASSNKLCDIDALEVPTLENLNVSNNNLKSLEIISNLDNLAVLDYSFNPINDVSVTELKIQFENVRVINFAGTRIAKCRNLIQLFPNAEVVDLAGTRVECVDDIRSLTSGMKHLRTADFRFCPVTDRIYPYTGTISSRAEFGSIDEYDRLYPDNADARTKYRKQVLAFCGSDFRVLDGIAINGNEKKYLNKGRGSSASHRRTPRKQVEYVECDAQTLKFNDSSDTDAVMQQLQLENTRLKEDKELLEQQNVLISRIECLFREQSQLRLELGLGEVDIPELLSENISSMEQLILHLERENRDLRRLISQKTPPKPEKKPKSPRPAKKDDQRHQYLAYLQAENEQLREEITKRKEEKQRRAQERRHRETKRPKHHTKQEPKRHKHKQKRSEDKAKIDPQKVSLIHQLMAENALFRNHLGLDPIHYRSPDSFSAEEADQIIDQLRDHNIILREQIDHQEALLAAKGPPDLDPYHPEEPKQSKTHGIVQDFVDQTTGCNFWATLNSESESEPQVSKSPHAKTCRKWEKVILRMSRVPLYPPDATSIDPNCDEFRAVESWITYSLDRRVRVENLQKSSFFWKVIENERTMKNMHLVVSHGSNTGKMITNGADNTTLVAEHMQYVLRDLTSNGECEIMIGVFDGGREAVNHCEHTEIPIVEDNDHDSLRFKFDGYEALLTLNPARLVPLYSARLISK